jgi:hypothetical protein
MSLGEMLSDYACYGLVWTIIQVTSGMRFKYKSVDWEERREGGGFGHA